jgi:hypothetical protein
VSVGLITTFKGGSKKNESVVKVNLEHDDGGVVIELRSARELNYGPMKGTDDSAGAFLATTRNNLNHAVLARLLSLRGSRLNQPIRKRQCDVAGLKHDRIADRKLGIRHDAERK